VLLVGVAAGLCLALASVRVLESLLFGMSARDSVTLVTATLVLAVAAFAAGYLPARRAMRTDQWTPYATSSGAHPAELFPTRLDHWWIA